MSKNVEYHDDCPVCKKTIQRVQDKEKKHLLYYCKNCKQKYRIDVIHQSQEIKCPHCNKVIRLSQEQVSQLYMKTVFNFHERKVKING